MGFIVGFVLFVWGILSSFVSTFITVHHEVSEKSGLYTVGWKDLCVVYFYTRVAIIVHALVQKYVVDKAWIAFNLHLSEILPSEFYDAGPMLVYSLFTALWGAHIIDTENYMGYNVYGSQEFPLSRNPKMSFELKFFMLVQISYWIAATLLLMMTKTDVVQKVSSSRPALYGIPMVMAYLFNFSRIYVLLLVFHCVPEILLNAARMLHVARKDVPANLLFLVGNVAYFVASLLWIMYTLTVCIQFAYAPEPTDSEMFGNIVSNMGQLSLGLGVIFQWYRLINKIAQ